MDPQKFDYNQDYNYNFGSNYGPGFNPNNNFYNKRSRNMEVAALVLSIIAIASCSCIYVSIICGSLAMIFALLSKGGATSMSSMAMTSFWIAFAAVVITLIIYIGSFAAMLHEYGSIEGILKEYQNLTGIDYNELLKQMNTAKEYKHIFDYTVYHNNGKCKPHIYYPEVHSDMQPAAAYPLQCL